MTTRRGRPPKTTAEHISSGTLRPDRHARLGVVALRRAPGPALDDGLVRLVTHIAEHPPPWITDADRPALRLLQELAAEREDLLSELATLPPPPDTRRHLRAIGAEMAALLHGLGLTPYGRNRLGVVVEPEQPTTLDTLRAQLDKRSPRGGPD